ncbi:MAG: hypothetical protein KBS68_03385, partial [Clostridiales bacterium]|nr:hypothetical protein [Candidatus Crickella merdequi]
MSELIEAEERCSGGTDKAALEASVLSVVNQLISLSSRMGIDGNLWQNYIVYFALTDENAYTISRERTEAKEDSFSALALSDFRIIKTLMSYEFESLREVLSDTVIEAILDFRNDNEPSEYAGRAGGMVVEVRDKLKAAGSDKDFKAVLDDHYKIRGIGDFSFTDAFRIVEEDGDELRFKPIRATEKISFDDLIGYESQKSELMR